VVALPGPNGGLRLVAYVVAGGDPVTELDLRRYLADTLPGYLVPSRVAVLDRMPYTPSGKIDRKALPAELGGVEFVAPGTVPERTLAQVWADVLGSGPVGTHDNFFDLGGDSVRAIHVVAGARAAGWTITPRQVLTRQTLGELAAVAVPAGPARDAAGGDTYPLTPLQNGMVFHALFTPESTDYIVQFVFAIDGDLDVPALRGAWEHVVDRHPMLRTTFAWDDLPEPAQTVHAYAPVELRELDWRETPLAEVPARIEEHLAAERAFGVDLERTPPRRFDLIRIADGSHRFVWHGHHVLLDGWSVRIVLDEVRATYDSLHRDGTLPPLPEPVPFRPYVDWLRGHDPAKSEEYWRRVLDGVTAPTPLTLFAPRTAGDWGTNQGVAMEFGTVPPDVMTRLRDLARRHRITVGSIVHAAWALLLSRYGGGADVLFGSTVTGRSAPVPDVERAVGLLINTLPVRVRIPHDATVEQWLCGVHEQLVELRDFEHCALVDVRRQSRVPAGQRLFDTILMFDSPAPRPDLAPDGLAITPARTWEQTGYPLVLNAQLRDELRLRLDYQPARVDAGSAERLLTHLRFLLETIGTGAAGRVGTLPALPPEEWRAVVREFNDTSAAYPAESCLHQLFEARADRDPAAVAVVSGDDSVSYGELEARANRLANDLRALGTGPETYVGICVERGVEMAVTVLGVLKAGAAYVPLDPEYPAERLALMLEDTAAPVVLTQVGLVDRLAGYRGRVVCVDGGEDAARIARSPASRPRPEVTPEHLSYVIYTSGSTGRPKGTLIRHNGIVNYIWWMVTAYPRANGCCSSPGSASTSPCTRCSGRGAPARRSCSPARTATATRSTLWTPSSPSPSPPRTWCPPCSARSCRCSMAGPSRCASSSRVPRRSPRTCCRSWPAGARTRGWTTCTARPRSPSTRPRGAATRRPARSRWARRSPTPACTCWTPPASPCRSASPARGTWPATASGAATTSVRG